MQPILFACLMIVAAGTAAAVPIGTPTLTVDLAGHGPWTFDEAVNDPVVLELAVDSIVVFTWSGDAESYGGTIAGYRHGWDILDPDDPNDPGWTTPGFEPGLTSTGAMSFAAGTHVLHIAVEDDAGSRTLASFVLTITEGVANQRVDWGGLKAEYR